MNKLEIGLGIALIFFIIIAGVAISSYHQDEQRICKLYDYAKLSTDVAIIEHKLLKTYGEDSTEISELRLDDLEEKCK